MIQHTVVFRLRHPGGSPAEGAFLQAARRLADIAGVEGLEILRQISPKNDYRFGISMGFADQAAYDRYNADPVHVRFVRERWEVEVESFMEIDYVPL